MNYSPPSKSLQAIGNLEPRIILDKLSLCHTDSNPENVEKTCGMLISDHILKSIPGMQIIKSRRYKVSCRIQLPFSQSVGKQTVIFEAGPHSPNQSSHRLEFNPEKLSGEGLDDLLVFLSSAVDADPVEFFACGRVTRCDFAVNFEQLHHKDVIVWTSRLQKHGTYSDRRGNPQTTYLGTPRSRRLVAYEKPAESGSGSFLRLETRLKPGILGHQMASLKNPFSGVRLLPADFSKDALPEITPQFIADSYRIGGLKRVLGVLTPEQGKRLKKAFDQAAQLLPDMDALWLTWPQYLVNLGLGAHLGVVPSFHQFAMPELTNQPVGTF